MPGRSGPSLRFLVAAVLAFGLTLRLGDLAIDRADVEPVESRVWSLDGALRASNWLAARGAGPGDGRLDVAFFGDSTAFGAGAFAESVPARLEALLQKPAREADVHLFASAGQDAFAYRMLADRVADARPDLATLSLNLSSFSRAWRDGPRRPELAGMLRARSMPMLFALSPQWSQLTLDVGLRNMALVGLWEWGSIDAWYAVDRARLRFVSARRALETTLYGTAGPEKLYAKLRERHLTEERTQDGGARFKRAAYLRPFAAALGGIDEQHPMLGALVGAVRELRVRGVKVLVYVTPIHAQHMRELGLLDDSALPETIALVQAALTREGAYFADLHALLPESAFRDADAHLSFAGPDAGTTRVATTLASLVEQLAGGES